MAKRLLVVDGGGVTRLVKSSRLFVVDAGGVTRKLKRLFVVDGGGVSRQVYVAALLETTLTVGFDGVATYGYNSGVYGALATPNYNDAGGNARTVSVMIWDDNGLGSSASARLFLTGAGIPDTDTTFAEISINGVTLARSARSAYNPAASGGTATRWDWAVAPGLPLFTGAVPFVIS